MQSLQKLLLVSAIKPFGRKTEFTRETDGLQMEFFNNQVTRLQGVHSFRGNAATFCLYLLAENISIPAVVLDFPTQREFLDELKNGYTHVGFSFIRHNIYKVKWMAGQVRRHSPGTKILLGGYGTAVPGIEDLVPCDAVCRGEGVAWLRSYFGENINAPIRQPLPKAYMNPTVYGVGVESAMQSTVILPGVGCRMGCNFCATSHTFNKKYIPFIQTGKDLFNACLEGKNRNGCDRYTVLDENLFLVPERAKDFLALMEKHREPFTFVLVFGSANALREFGVDFFLRLGIQLVFMGVESKQPIYAKVKNVDFRSLIREFQDHGISILASTILFLDHHDHNTIQEEIDWAIDLDANFHQFMQFTPVPGTPLWDKTHEDGSYRDDIPHDMSTGMTDLPVRHPHFKPEEGGPLMREAFLRKFRRGGPGVIQAAHTAARGYQKAKRDMEDRAKQGLAWNPETLKYEKNEQPIRDEFMELRLERMRQTAVAYRPLLWAGKLLAPGREARQRCERTLALYKEVFGPPTWKEKILSATVACSGLLHAQAGRLRASLGLEEHVPQPPTLRQGFRMQ